MKRTLALLLALIMSVTLLFAGCQSNEKVNNGDGNKNEVKNETKNDTEKETEKETANKNDQKNEAKDNNEKEEGDPNLVGNLYKTGIPIVKETVTVDIAIIRNSLSKKNIEEKLYTKELEDRTNVKVNWQEIPGDSSKDKVNIMLASRDIPDALIGLLSGDQLVLNYDSGLFMPLNDLLDNWGPNIKECLDRNPITKTYLTLEDGNIYSTPMNAIVPWCDFSSHLFVNTVWLDNLGLEIPKTTDDFYNVLKEFKEKDANGNGDKDDEIPISFSGSNNMLPLFGAFGLPTNYSAKNRNYMIVEDGKVQFIPVIDNFKIALEYFNKLFDEGLIDNESFSQNINQLRAKGKNEEIALLGSYVQFLDDITVGSHAKDYKAITPLVGPLGDQEYYKEQQSGAIGLLISSETEYAEVIMRWVDYINRDTYGKQEADLGLESEGRWTKLDGGRYKDNQDNIPEGLTWGEYRYSEGWANVAPRFMDIEDVSKRDVDARTLGKWDMCKLYDPFAPEETLPKVLIKQDEQETITNINTDIFPLVDNFIAKSIMEGFSDSDWNKFKSNLEKARYEELQEVWQKIYDRTK